MAQLGIDVTNVAASVPREPIPANGWIKAVITESEVVPSKTDPERGRRLNLTFKVVEGEYVNRTFFGGLNIVNKSPVAQEIAMADLSAIGHAVGCLVIQDSQQLHNIPMWVKIKFVAATEQYEAKNEPNGYKAQSEKVDPMTPIGASRAPASAAAAPAFTPPAAAFVPPAVAPAAAASAAPAWQAPAAAQPWTPPAATAAPAQQPLSAPAALAPAAAPAFVAPAAAAAPAPVAAAPAGVAIDPATGLALPPWQQPAPAAA